MKETVLVNVARDKSQLKLNLGLAVLVNSLRIHNIEVQLLDLLTIDVDHREEYFLKHLPKRPAIV